MTRKKHVRLIHEGGYAAEVEIELIVTDDEWSPYLSLADAQKLDDVRIALRAGDLQTANKMALVYKLMPVAV